MKPSIPIFPQVAHSELIEVKVLVMFEDQATGLNANALLARLSSQCGLRVGLTKNPWLFRQLNTPPLCKQAAIEASQAGLILLSLNGKTEWLALVQEWLARWLSCREDRPYAFCVLLASERGGLGAANPVAAYVREFADAAGVDFFCGSFETTFAGVDGRFNEIRARANRSSRVLEDIMKLGH